MCCTCCSLNQSLQHFVCSYSPRGERERERREPGKSMYCNRRMVRCQFVRHRLCTEASESHLWSEHKYLTCIFIPSLADALYKPMLQIPSVPMAILRILVAVLSIRMATVPWNSITMQPEACQSEQTGAPCVLRKWQSRETAPLEARCYSSSSRHRPLSQNRSWCSCSFRHVVSQGYCR